MHTHACKLERLYSRGTQVHATGAGSGRRGTSENVNGEGARWMEIALEITEKQMGTKEKRAGTLGRKRGKKKK